MRIDNIDERHFYEIEAAQNDWSLAELKRQFNSALFERLALSKEKDKVFELANKGQVIKRPQDIVKDDKPLGVVEAYIKENTTELVDPLDIKILNG